MTTQADQIGGSSYASLSALGLLFYWSIPRSFHFGKLQTCEESGEERGIRCECNYHPGSGHDVNVIIIQGLATSMLSSIILMLFVDFAIMGTLVFTALSFVGLLAGLGIVIAADFGLIASSSG